MPRRVVVTGGCGFVGAAIADALADAGHRVTVVDRRLRRSRADISFLEADITRPAWTDACRGAESIVHCAARVQTTAAHADAAWRTNLEGTHNVLAACREHGVPRLVHISSASVVIADRHIENGDERLPYAEPAPGPYAASKIAAERAVLAFDGATRACVLRPHAVFGPGDPRFLPGVLRGGRWEVGNRETLTDFTYVANVADAVLAAEERLAPGSPLRGQAYFVTNGEPTPFFEFVERLLSAIGVPRPRRRIPYPLAYAASAVAETFTDGPLSRSVVRYLRTHHYFSIAKARRDLGWTPAVSLAEGIRLTAATGPDRGRRSAIRPDAATTP